MNLFHHITIFSLTEEEKKHFVEAGVEFTRVMKASRGETVMFEIGESDPRYEKVAALLRSLGTTRVSDFSMTVPTLREFIEKTLRPSAERLNAMQEKWERGREVLRESVDFLKAGRKEQALKVVEPAITEAIQEKHHRWASILCRHAAVIAHSMGDRQRQIHYEEQALPFANDYRFAAYNFAQLLLSDGQIVRAEIYAAEAYRQSITQTTESDGDLRVAILRQWPNVAQNA